MVDNGVANVLSQINAARAIMQRATQGFQIARHPIEGLEIRAKRAVPL